jgi:hypothetical protein
MRLYVVMSCVRRCLWDGLITRPEEPCRVSNCMCDHRNPERGLVFQLGTYRKINEWKLNMIAGPDDGGSMHDWNVGLLPQAYTALHPRKLSIFILTAVRIWNLTFVKLSPKLLQLTERNLSVPGNEWWYRAGTSNPFGSACPNCR